MKIAFRVDASVQIGTGHFMRCLTLADGLREHGCETLFVCRHLPEHMRVVLETKGHRFGLLHQSSTGIEENKLAHSEWLGTTQQADAAECSKMLSGQVWDWLVVDHYALDARWESSLRQSVGKIFVIDDIADRSHDCDVLLDQNFYDGMEDRYVGKTPPACRRLLGPRYALLRKEFSRLRAGLSPRAGAARRLLVFFGGIDRENYTGAAIAAVARIGGSDLSVDVVIGERHPFKGEILRACSENRFLCHVETDRMADLMAAADLFIGAGGGATLERFCLGLPSLVIPTAENQIRQVRDAAAETLLYSPEANNDIQRSIEIHLQALLQNPLLMNAISRNSMAVADGGGVSRVIGCLGCAEIEVRPAGESDSDSVYSWRNHPSIRSVSRNSQPISRHDHQMWFARTLSSTASPLLIGHRGGTPVGVVRFDVDGNTAEVSIYRVPDGKEKGLGFHLLEKAEQWLAANRPEIHTLQAHVIGDNGRSRQLFLRSGYRLGTTIFTKTLHGNDGRL